MSADSLTRAQILAMQSVISQISSTVATIYTNANAPYSTADIDASLAQSFTGYTSRLTEILNELTRLQINISAG